MQGGNNLQPTSANAVNDFLSTLALLGQQLRQFSNTTAQQCHQNQPLQSSSLGFSLGVNGQEQAHAHQNQQQPHSQSMLLGGGGGGGGGQRNGGGMFQHLHHGNMGSTLDQPQFGGQMMNPPTFPESSVASQSMDVQGIMERLSMLKERVQQLQALVPLISQTAHLQTDSHVVAQQQAASAAVVSIISQLAIAAIGLLPQKPFGTTNTAVTGSVNPSTELPLTQLLQAAVSPSTNFFQLQQNAPQREEGTSSLGHLTGTDIFGTSGAAAGVPGVTAGVSGDFSLRSFSGGDHAFPGLNNEDDLSEQQQNVSEQQAGGIAMSLHEQMTEGDVGKEFVGSGGGGDGGSNGRGAVNNNNLDTLLRSSLAAGRSSGNNFITHDLGAMSNEDVDNYDSGRMDDDDSDGETLSPGSFDLVELDPTEILAEHTHFCEICGKGFKRDANLRMHMRGHGDEYKTPQALARPDRGGAAPDTTKARRFSCPYAGCKRNKKHRKFQPLKTMLCVKNHYRRSHCPKLLTCQKCKVKKFSVVADLKTHEKHCGRDRWLCSCGSTFSRKDKLYGHLGLFAGHMPVMPHELDTAGGDGGGANSAAEQQEPPAEATFGSEGKSDSMRFWDS